MWVLYNYINGYLSVIEILIEEGYIIKRVLLCNFIDCCVVMYYL